MSKKVLIGIDYSITSPAITVSVSSGDEGVSFQNCSFHFLTSRTKAVVWDEQLRFFGTAYPKDYANDQERFAFIAMWAYKRIEPYHLAKDEVHVGIEDYAFAGKGKVFNLAENTGLLKHVLWSRGVSFSVVPPTVVKKLATGKGNAKKPDMYEQWVRDTGYNAAKLLMTEGIKEDSPTGDVVDSFYIAKWLASKVLPR